MTTTVSPLHAGAEAVLLRPTFPSHRFSQASDYGAAYFAEWARAAQTIDPQQLELAAATLLDAYTAGATVFTCGNGGSAAVSDHLQCDHLKGIRTGTDLLPSVTSLTSNVDLITAIANDIGYEEVFAYQLESHAHPADVLLAISSSGASANIVRALAWARAHDLRTVAFTGFDGGEARRVADISVHVDSANYGIVEDLHQTAMHAIAQFIRQSRMDDRTIAITRF
jgi:phosphoheptose isomerase